MGSSRGCRRRSARIGAAFSLGSGPSYRSSSCLRQCTRRSRIHAGAKPVSSRIVPSLQAAWAKTWRIAATAFVAARCEHDMLPYMEQHGNDIGELVASHSSSSLLGDYSCVPLLIQVTRFRCGGLTLGLERDHEACDGTAASQFFLDWSFCARTGSPSLQVPLVHSRSAMMPRQPPRPAFDHPEYETVRLQDIPNGSATTTVRIHFNVEEVARLKAQAGNSYSTFVSLSALLWKNLTKLRVLRPESDSSDPLDLEAENAFVFTVDGRRSLSAGPGFFGNAAFFGMAVYTGKQLVELPLSDIAEKVYASVKSTLKEERMRSAIDYIALHKQKKKSSSSGRSFDPHLVVTSWTRFPFYDMDFGFGSPVSVSTLESICSLVKLLPSNPARRMEASTFSSQ